MATGGRLTRSDSQTPGHLVQLGQLGGPGTRRHQKFAAFFWTYVARDKLLKSRSSAEQRLLVPCKAQLLQLLDKQKNCSRFLGMLHGGHSEPFLWHLGLSYT